MLTVQGHQVWWFRLSKVTNQEDQAVPSHIKAYIFLLCTRHLKAGKSPATNWVQASLSSLWLSANLTGSSGLIFFFFNWFFFLFDLSKCTLNALLWTFRTKPGLVSQQSLSFSPWFLWLLPGSWRRTWLFIQHPPFHQERHLFFGGTAPFPLRSVIPGCHQP